MSARDDVQAMLRALLDQRGDGAPFGDDEALIAGGRLDSIDVLEIVTWLEARGVDFARLTFAPERVESVDALLALLREAG